MKAMTDAGGEILRNGGGSFHPPSPKAKLTLSTVVPESINAASMVATVDFARLRERFQ
jgi:hypothetical protein